MNDLFGLDFIELFVALGADPVTSRGSPQESCFLDEETAVAFDERDVDAID